MDKLRPFLLFDPNEKNIASYALAKTIVRNIAKENEVALSKNKVEELAVSLLSAVSLERGINAVERIILSPVTKKNGERMSHNYEHARRPKAKK
jgi:hypothetical protein